MTTTNRFQHHPQPRTPFVFAAQDQGNTAMAAKANPDERGSRALEYIAMYLDRIETHLDLIATTLETGGFNEPLRAQLAGILHQIATIARAR